MGIEISGISIVSFPSSKDPSAEKAELVALYPLENVDSPKFKRKAIGRTTDVSFGKSALVINPAYAHRLIDTQAFISNKEYEVKFEFNSSTMDNEIVELVPVDPSVAKHFNHCMGVK